MDQDGVWVRCHILCSPWWSVDRCRENKNISHSTMEMYEIFTTMWMNEDHKFFDQNRRLPIIALSMFKKNKFCGCAWPKNSQEPARADTDANSESLLKIMPILGKNKRHVWSCIHSLHVQKISIFYQNMAKFCDSDPLQVRFYSQTATNLARFACEYANISLFRKDSWINIIKWAS